MKLRRLANPFYVQVLAAMLAGCADAEPAPATGAGQQVAAFDLPAEKPFTLRIFGGIPLPDAVDTSACDYRDSAFAYDPSTRTLQRTACVIVEEPAPRHTVVETSTEVLPEAGAATVDEAIDALERVADVTTCTADGASMTVTFRGTDGADVTYWSERSELACHRPERTHVKGLEAVARALGAEVR